LTADVEGINHEEQSLIYAALGQGSSFVDAFMHLCGCSDHSNLARLRRCFPEWVQAYDSWFDGDLIDRALAAGLVSHRSQLTFPRWGRREETT
jgi:hypothetical protein